MRVHETQIRVRYGETDQMGIAHHSNYFLWFEEARTDFLRAMGQTYRSLEEEGVMLPVVGVQCKFIRSLKYDELMTVRTWISDLGRVRVTFAYEIVGEDGTRRATAESTLAVLGKDGKIRALPERLQGILEGLG